LPPVPIVVDANSFPLLRWKGVPQSELVSAVIRHKIKQKDTRSTWFEAEHDFALALGQDEDDWEAIVQREMEREGLLNEDDDEMPVFDGRVQVNRPLGYRDSIELVGKELDRLMSEQFRKSEEWTRIFMEKRWEME